MGKYNNLQLPVDGVFIRGKVAYWILAISPLTSALSLLRRGS
jgi:hypothetical protein